MAEKVARVFVNGTFDVLHMGHLSLLYYAKSLGDILLVAIDSDERVRQLKGETRPINNQDERKTLLLALKPVSGVSVFNTDRDLTALIKNYEPDIMVVGSDWQDKPVIGSEFAKKVVYFERIPEYSTTKKIQYIIDRG